MRKASYELLQFRGGLDIVTPPWLADPGGLLEVANCEIGVEGGYDTVIGYERFDGQPKPSDAVYSHLPCNITGIISVGDVVDGVGSGASGVVILVGADFIVYTKATGIFISGEDIEVSASVEATSTDVPSINGGASPILRAQYRNLGADEYRNDIDVPPGSGPTLGLTMIDDVKYSFRNNAGDTATDIYKSTASGFVKVELGFDLEFTSGGTDVPLEGHIIEGATSGATATITRVVRESGEWGDSDAAGRLFFASQTGTFVAEDLDIDGNLNVCSIAGDSNAITILPDGDYEINLHNFGGMAGVKRAYGADGVNRGFEFDGSVFVYINTGMPDDTPSSVFAHKNHLFFAFDGSAQHSGIGEPYIWLPIFGALEIALGDDITAFQAETGSEGNAALGIYSKNSTHILYGSNASDWNLVRYRDEVGAAANTVQQVGHTIMLDDRGITELRTVQAFGNFAHSAISAKIHSWIILQKTKATTSCIVRDKNQYRLFFSDGTSAWCTFNGGTLAGIMQIIFPDPVLKMFSLENNNGDEEIFFGSSNGMIYQMERGTSFDGENILSYLRFQHFNAGNPRKHKNWKGVALEVRGSGYSEINFNYQIGYGADDKQQPNAIDSPVEFSVINWDGGAEWDTAFWDGKTLLPSNFNMSGRAENMSMVLSINSDYYSQIKLSGAVVRYLLGRDLR